MLHQTACPSHMYLRVEITSLKLTSIYNYLITQNQSNDLFHSVGNTIMLQVAF